MKVYRLEKPEATYFIDDASQGHFGFDCSCGENKVEIPEDPSGFRQLYEPLKGFSQGHSFRIGGFKEELELRPKYNFGNLIIICSNCRSEFVFNQEIFRRLEEEICREENLVNSQPRLSDNAASLS